MALFPSLDLEKKIQVGDKTRFDGQRSYVSKGSTAISTITVQAGGDGSPIDVFDTDTEERFLDFQFTAFQIDIDATNNKLDFNEGGSELTATLSTGTFTLTTLAAEIKTQMDSAGALTYTVVVSKDDKITISSTDAFSLLPTDGSNSNVSILPTIGFSPKPGFGDNDFSNRTPQEGLRVRELPRAITVVIGDGSTTESLTKTIQLMSVDGDQLFSNDQDLVFHRHDILQFVPEGRNSFLNVHRRAQDLIMAWLDEQGYIDIFGDPLGLKSITDLEEVRQWSTFLALRIIHDEQSNSQDDDFFAKAREFGGQEKLHRDRAIIRVDLDNDGKADIDEGITIRSGTVFRR